jgi:uncharacterized repeat protein (TIGR03803 family)
MNYKRFLGAASAALMIIIAILMLAQGAGAASKYETLYKFTGGKDGSRPGASLIFDQAGNLYGTTEFGGAHGLGTVFKLAPNADGSWRESVLHSFCPTNCGDGEYPDTSLIFDQAGNLYSTTASGGAHEFGTVFQLVPNADGSWRESVLYSFCSRTNCCDGVGPFASLIFDQAGNLYGTTSAGGAHGGGIVFKLAPNADGSWRESVLYSFCSRTNCGDGQEPWASLIFDQAGNLYGTTNLGGGALGGGTVFKLAPNADGSWRESVLHRFCSRTNCSDGTGPYAGLVFDLAGNLYGTTFAGGDQELCLASGCGVVFKLTPNSKGGWNERVLHTFADRPGASPRGGLIFDPAGNLYGTSSGSTTFGSVFEIASRVFLSVDSKRREMREQSAVVRVRGE